MPNINSIPEVVYEPNQPYHHYYDNLPLRNILTRIGLVNIQTDTNSDLIRGAAGTAGSIDARMNASMDGDGSLKASAMDSALHGIGSHIDGHGPDGVLYVRMKEEEREKLHLIQSEANRLVVEIEDGNPTVGEVVTISEGPVRFAGSSTVFVDFETPNTVRMHVAFPPESAHRHHYGIVPAHRTQPGGSSSGSGPDYKKYKTTSLGTSYREGSLRVHVNGVRLGASPVPTPNHSGNSFNPTYIENEDPSVGEFELNRSISESDVIIIDFDETFET
jgi:hypothetical protein